MALGFQTGSFYRLSILALNTIEMKGFYLIIFTLSLFTISCSQLATFHSADTEGRGNMTLSPTVSGYGYSAQAGGGELGSGTLPFAQLELAYGLTENLDILGSISSGGNFKGSLKYRMIGYDDARFSMSIMPGYEYQSTYGNNNNFANRLHLPLIMSIKTSDDIGLFFAPKYVIQVANGEEIFSFPGASAGLVINRKIKYVLGGGTFIPISSPVGAQGYIFQVGASARIPIISN